MLTSLPVIDLIGEEPADADENRSILADCKKNGVCRGCGLCCVEPELAVIPPPKEGEPSERKQRWQPCPRLRWEVQGTRRVARCVLQDQKGARDDLKACDFWKGNRPHGHFTLAEHMHHRIIDDILREPVPVLFDIEALFINGLIDDDVIAGVRARLQHSEDDTSALLERLLLRNDTGRLPVVLLRAIGLVDILHRLQPAWRHQGPFRPWSNPLHAAFEAFCKAEGTHSENVAMS